MKQTESINEWTVRHYKKEWEENPEEEYRLDLNERYLNAAIELLFDEYFKELSNAYLDNFKDTKFYKNFRLVNDDGIPVFVAYPNLKRFLTGFIIKTWYELGVAL